MLTIEKCIVLCIGERLSNFDVRVGDISEGLASNSLCSHYLGTASNSEVVTIKCEEPKPEGRYVSIQLMSNGQPLVLCEVQIYGSKF